MWLALCITPKTKVKVVMELWLFTKNLDCHLFMNYYQYCCDKHKQPKELSKPDISRKSTVFLVDSPPTGWRVWAQDYSVPCTYTCIYTSMVNVPQTFAYFNHLHMPLTNKSNLFNWPTARKTTALTTFRSHT